jgi:ABC-type phosphate transport system permease subunit
VAIRGPRLHQVQAFLAMAMTASEFFRRFSSSQLLTDSSWNPTAHQTAATW